MSEVHCSWQPTSAPAPAKPLTSAGSGVNSSKSDYSCSIVSLGGAGGQTVQPDQFFIELRTSGVSDTHCDKVAKYFQDYSRVVAQECRSKTECETESLHSIVALDQSCSVFRQNTIARRKFLTVEPQEIRLDTPGKKPSSLQFVPLTSQLQSIFLSERFRDTPILEPITLSPAGLYRTLFDGLCHQSEENKLSLILFYDDFVVTCPL